MNKSHFQKQKHRLNMNYFLLFEIPYLNNIYRIAHQLFYSTKFVFNSRNSDLKNLTEIFESELHFHSK